MELAEQYGELGKAIEFHIEQTIKKTISEFLEPIIILRDFENVDILTLDEVCKVLRCNSKEKIRDACKRGELPYLILGRDYLFPKTLFAEYLLGIWKKPELKNQTDASKSDSPNNKIRIFLE